MEEVKNMFKMTISYKVGDSMVKINVVDVPTLKSACQCVEKYGEDMVEVLITKQNG